MAVDIPKHPFNDYKHIPSRPEIDLALGVLPAIELKRFETRLELIERNINWAFHWYDDLQGWGYRASYKERVLCILHFYQGWFTVTLSIPEAKEEQFLALKELTPAVREAFAHYKPSPKMKWITFKVRKPADTDALMSVAAFKLEDLREKTAGRK